MKITFENTEYELMAEIIETQGKLKVRLLNTVTGEVLPEWQFFEEKRLTDAIEYARKIALMDRRQFVDNDDIST